MKDVMQLTAVSAMAFLFLLAVVFEPPWLPVLLGLAPAGVLPW